MLRWLTSGESHGKELVAILEGLPAGVVVDMSKIEASLVRRRLGYGRGARMKFEEDRVTILGGVRHGLSLGGPVALTVANTEWDKWKDVMSPLPVGENVLESLQRNVALTRPRPGHADFVGMQKYGFLESRPVLERSSARETAARVALGAVVGGFLGALGISVLSHVVALGDVSVPKDFILPKMVDVTYLDADPVRCFCATTSLSMVAAVDAAKVAGDTLGGVVEVLVYGLPAGLGSYVHWDRRLDSRLAGALMSVPAVKGVEFGEGFLNASLLGSQVHDEMFVGSVSAVKRVTNRCGGVEGGMSNGEVLRLRAAMKPISTVPKALRTVDVATGFGAKAHGQRSDVCAVPAAGVVAEAMVALVVAEAVLEKFGGDSLVETKRNFDNYLTQLGEQFEFKQF